MRSLSSITKQLVGGLRSLFVNNRQLIIGISIGVLVASSLGISAKMNSSTTNTAIPDTNKYEASENLGDEDTTTASNQTLDEPEVDSDESAGSSEPNGATEQTNQSNNQGQGKKELCVLLDGRAYCPVVNQQLVTFYYEKIGRFVPINTYGTEAERMVLGETIDLEYTSADCSGTPYLAYFNDSGYKSKIYNNLLTAGYNKRYIANASSSPITITRNSQKTFNYNTESTICHDGGGVTKTVIPLTLVSIPVQEPVSGPFEYTYE